MRTDEDAESAPVRKPGADKARKKKSTTHVHIGPYKLAYQAGLALCPVCDAEKIHTTSNFEQREQRRSSDSAPRPVPAPREPSKTYARTKR